MPPATLVALLAGTGVRLVSASPQRPAQPVGQLAQRPGGQADEQVADLLAGERDQLGRWWVAPAPAEMHYPR
jgi:hypothetical protein